MIPKITDIIEKLSEMLDADYRSFTPSGKNSAGGSYKTQHRLAVRGRKAWMLMEKVEPFLSARRKEQISKVRATYKPKTQVKTEGYISRKKPIHIPFFKLYCMLHTYLTIYSIGYIIPVRSSNGLTTVGTDLSPSRSVTLWVAHDL